MGTQQPDLVVAGDVKVDGSIVERAIVIRFPDTESIKAAMKTGRVSFTVFGQDAAS